MTSPQPGQARAHSRSDWRGGAVVCALVGLLPWLAISGQSYWIDEALTALKAAQPTLHDWWAMMASEKLSDLQMPLYMLYAWVWGQVFGTSEWALRAANLPWFATGAAVFAFSFNGAGRTLAALVAALSGFAWFYLDEARPYGMQLGASLLVIGALRRLWPAACAGDRLPSGWLWALGVGLAALAGSSLIGMFWAGVLLVGLTALTGRRGLAGVWRAGQGVWLVVALVLAGLGAYYVWTLAAGARASPAVGAPWMSAVWIAYELLGFGGLGPGRLAVRAAGVGAFYPYWPLLAAYAVFVAAILRAGWRSADQEGRRAWVVAGVVGVGAVAVLLAAGWLTHFRVLGRHCAPLWAAVVLGLAQGCAAVWRRGVGWSRLILAGFLVVSAVSCLSARFATRHLKDDYRSAAAFARAALVEGRRVWWCADPHGAAVYGLALAVAPAEGPGVCVLNPRVSDLAGLPPPDVVVVSKPDLYDRQGALAAWLGEHRFRPVGALPAFTLWAVPDAKGLRARP